MKYKYTNDHTQNFTVDLSTFIPPPVVVGSCRAIKTITPQCVHNIMKYHRTVLQIIHKLRVEKPVRVHAHSDVRSVMIATDTCES